jgi:glutaredoxin
MILKVYSMTNCPYCKELKDLLIAESLPFDDVDITLPENKDEVEKVFEVSKCDSVPIVRVGNQLLAPDISFYSIKEAFEMVKKFYKS